ncbi:DUF1178 family protein [Zavarzinia sp. CC-PAN008]|uniref:DUF1178 family protein n=1 Tax=Zavarzinia sp. CC-PAN008 TaxID=3243332 RepID=UPI003F74910B
MIVYDLKCEAGHVFEAWYKDSDAYAKLRAAEAIACPDCASTRIERAPSVPMISTGKGAAEHAAAQARAKVMAMLREVRSQVESNCDYVGERFAEEARRIHYGETPPRGIYGEATPDEAEALSDEGVEVAAIPWVPRTDD